MAEKVRDRLRELTAYLESEHAVDSVEESVEHLQLAVADAMARSRGLAQQCTILLFQSHEPPSLMEFLDQSGRMSEDLRKRDISHARIKVLELLAGFVKTYSQHAAVTRTHIVNTMRRCQGIARSDWSNKVRSEALKVVIHVLKYATCHISSADVEPVAYLEKIVYDLKFGKASQTAKGTMLEVIGHLTAVFPDEVKTVALPLIAWIEDQLEKQFGSASPETLLVAGLLIALARLVVFDPSRYKEDATKRQQVYSYLARVLATTVDGQLSRYQVTKASLQFLEEHSQTFIDELGENGYTWFTYMRYCAAGESKTIKENALACANNVLAVIGEFLVQSQEESRKKTLNRVLKEVLPVLNDKSADTSTMAFALRCLARIAPAVRMYLGEKAFLKIEGRLRKFGENLLVLDDKATAMRWSVFSSYVECVGCFVKQERSTSIDDTNITFLGDLICHLLDAYPRCLWKSKLTIYKSVLSILCAMYSSGDVQLLLDRIVHRAFLLSISNVTQTEELMVLYHPETGNIETKLLYEYEDLWVALLRGKKHTKYRSKREVTRQASSDTRREDWTTIAAIRGMLLDSLFKSLQAVVGGLNLAYQYDLQDGAAQGGGYKPNVARDHSIMLNMTEFIERVLPRLSPESLRAWIPILLMLVVEKSDELPLVSGFYRIARVLTTVSEKTKYFDEMRDTSDAGSDVRVRRKYLIFAKRVIRGIRFYKDELLVASSGCVLAAPLGLVPLIDIVQAMVPALILGKSFLPAADMAITCVERWQQERPWELDLVLDQIIPCLTAYFDQSDAVDPEIVVLKGDTSDGGNSESTNATERSKLQRRIMAILGKMGGYGALLASQGAFNSADAKRGFQTSTLQLPITLNDILIDLPLNKIFDHIGSLACDSTDRRVKVGACEVYHAMASYLCGKTATNPHTSGSKSAYFEVWASVFSRLIILATDAEKVCRALFEPLLFQLTTWFSKGSESFPHEYSRMLDDLVIGLSDRTNTAVREVSGKCLAACLSSSIEGSGSVAKAEVLFHRLFALCRHPGPAERIGAATTMSYFLRSLREENSVVISAFSLRCMKNLLYSLRLCDDWSGGGNEATDIAQEIITKAILRLQRAISRFSPLFLSSQDEEENLKSLTTWLFHQCSRPESSYRRMCRQLFMAFAAIVNGTSCKKWIQAYASTEGCDRIVEILAPMDNLVLGLRDDQVSDPKVWWDVANWMRYVTASLECYGWCSDVLGDDAKTIIFSTSGGSTALKRKLDELEPTRSETSSEQTTIAWTVNRFLEIHEAIVSKTTTIERDEQYKTRHQLLDAFIQSAGALSDLLLKNSRSTMSTNAVSEFHLEDRDDVIADLILSVIGLLVGGEVSGSLKLLGKFKLFCAEMAERRSSLATSLRKRGDSITSKLLKTIQDDSGESSESPTVRIDRQLLSLRLVNELVVCDVVERSKLTPHVENFVSLATKALGGASVDPNDRILALEAIKAGCFGGWDMPCVFDDRDLRRKLSSIYRDIILLLPHRHIWSRVAKLLITDNITTQRLVGLVELLTEVATLKVHRAGSSEMDNFVEDFLPHLKSMIGKMADEGNDAQRTRLCLESIRQTVDIFKHCSRRMTDVLDLGPFPDMRDATITVLKRREISSSAKGDCLSILAGLGAAMSAEGIKQIAEVLAAFVVDEFPISSADVRRGTRDYEVFQLLMDKLLLVVEECRSVELLKVLYSSLKEGTKHLFANTIQSSLGRLATNVSGSSGPRFTLDYMMELLEVLLDPAGDLTVRRMLLENLFVPLAELQKADNLREFYMLETKTSKVTMISKLATVVSNSSDVASQGAISTAAVAYTLVELLYRLVDPESIRGEINRAFLGHDNGKGRELTMLICKCASKFITKTHDDLSETTRFSCSQAYNCLLTAVSRTQKQERFYDQILFQEALWKNIIDGAREISLKAETKAFDRVPLSSFSARTLRNQHERQSQGGTQSTSSRAGKRNRSAALQFFTASSLSQTAMTSEGIGSLQLDAELAAREAIYQGIDIELDSINDHPCMIPLLRVLLQMKTDFADSWDDKTMPGWMQKIHNVTADSTTEVSVRLFLVKIVLNVPDVFAKYADKWAEKLMEAIIEATMVSSSDKKAEFNYMIRDCCHLLAGEWKDVSVGSCSMTASRFVNHLISLSPNEESNFIMRDNIRAMSELITLWKDHVRIDRDEVIKLLFSSDDNNPKREAADRYTALQIVSTMLTAGLVEDILPDFDMSDGKTIEDGVLASLDHKRVSIYTVAAEISGLLLKAKAGSTAQAFRDKLAEHITKYYSEEEFGRFLALLRSVSLHEPKLLDSTMLHRLSFVLPKVIAIEAWSLSAVHCLFLALNNEEVVQEIFTHCQQVLGRFVLHRSAVVQLTALQLIERLIDHLDVSVACRFVMREDQGGIDLFGDTVRERDIPVRRVFYDITKKLYQKNLDEPLKDRLRLALLQGLADPDISIRTEVFAFCNGSDLLPDSCRDRVLELYQSMYAPGVEDVWLLYAANTLMALTRGSRSYDSLLFTNPLSDGEYRDAAIDAAWETKNETMTPLFSVEADKFSFSAATQMGSLTEASIQSQGQLWGSSTQSLDGLFDGGSASSSQLISSSQDFPGSTSSQFADSSQIDGRQPTGKRRRRFVKKQSTVFSSGEVRGAKGADKRYFQERYALFKKTEEAILNRQRKARDQQVQMRRNYRIGEYPDIQIKLKDIIDPLMALCEMHEATSAIVMAEVMSSVVATKSFDDEGTLRTLGARMESALTTGKSSLVFTSAVHLTYYSCIMRKKSVIQMLSISAKVVGDSSLASGSLHSGELILEEFLTQGVASSADVTAEAWDHLYKILATTQKSNLLTALASKCCVTDDSKLALEARLAGDLPGAIASYRKAESALTSEWETEPDFAVAQAQFEANRCYWERLQCLETLNNWDKLRKELGTSEDGALWNEESPYLEQGVKHSLHSTLALIERPADPEDEDSEIISVLRSFLDDAHKEPKRWDLLQTKFGVELSLSSLVFGDVNQARVFVEKLFPSFLARWNGTSRIANLTRLELMQTLSSAVELDEILSISQKAAVKAESTTTMDSRYISFVEGWNRALPSQGEGSMALWSHFYLVQQVVRSFLLHSGSQNGIISDMMERVFNQEHAQLMLKYAQAAVANDLLAVASKYLKDYRELCNAENLPKVSVLMVDVFVSHVQKLAERQAQKSSSMASHGGLTSDAINTIMRYYQTSTKMFDNTDILELMESLPLHDRVAMGSLEAKTFGQAAQFYMIADLDKSMTEEFFTRAIDVFQRSCRSIPGEITMVALSRESEQSFSRCRVTFIEYLIDILFSEKRAEWMALVEQKSMLESLTENVLSGMVAGDQECSNYLPQLCELIPPFPDIVAKFEKRILTEVPMWTCLRWTAQLLALVNGPIGKSIVRILEKMATEYPAALFYDFKVTCAGEMKTDIRRLTTLLSKPVMEKFVAALRLIHHPELRFKEGLREVSKLLESGKASEAKAKMTHVWQDCFASEHPLLGGQIGHYNRDWAKRAKRDVEKMLGRDGSNVTAKSVNAAREWIMNHFSVMPGKFGITKDMKARIADFADWLDEFDHTKCRLELPGQYTSYWGKPDLSNHTYILSVGAQLGVLVSKQLPKQITFHCSDQKEYTFLVKGGEDLRLDQRIEQLFDVMNQILASHPRCRDRHLRTKTYRVIPMTTEIGMIEWLHNTSTLKGVIEKQLQVDLRCTDLLSNKRAKLQLFNTIPAKNYETYLMKQRGGSFAAKVIAPSHKDVVANFEGVQALIPADLLRLQLLGLGSDFEDFVSIRDQFASSLGVFSACSYILGIGDRHLDNFLLDHQTGRVIGIDFGVSFGAGASVLPVPELIPFRFTRQMETVLQPYDGSNLLIQDMQAVFEALREKKQVIESVMNVFLHEPLLDWQQSTTTHQREIFETNQEVTQEVEDVAMKVEEVVKPSKRQKRSTMTPSTSSSSSEGGQTATSLAWLPDVKVAIARRKLEGYSPRALLKEELAQNTHLGKQLKLFQALVDTANAQASGASSTTSGAMSSLAQAQDLLALASAPDILGRTFQGWMPWL